MTEQNIPADLTPEEVEAAREWATSYRNGFYKPGHADAAARALTALLPAPPRPTLADMDEEEQRDAVGMWADVDGFHPYRAVIGDTPAPKVPVFRPTAGALDWVHPEDVTPLPELGRAWGPGGSPAGTPAPAPALPDGWRLADHKGYGRVIVTTENPDDDGFLAFVHRADDRHRQHAHGWCKPDALTYIDSPTTEEGDTPTGPNDVAVGTVIESADDPRLAALPYGSILLDRDEEATTKRLLAWTGRGCRPIPSEGAEFGPWKVLYIPKENEE